MAKQYDKNNVFAKIIRGEIASKQVYQDDDILIIHDISQAAPVHVLAMPKGEYISFNDFVQNAPADKISQFFKKIQETADKLGIVDSGYRIITNHGADASQSVAHFHVHLLGGTSLGGLLPGDKKVR